MFQRIVSDKIRVGLLPLVNAPADTRILLHAKGTWLHEFDRVVIVCRDTDVLVLLLHLKEQLLREIWFMSGTQKVCASP